MKFSDKLHSDMQRIFGKPLPIPEEKIKMNTTVFLDIDGVLNTPMNWVVEELMRTGKIDNQDGSDDVQNFMSKLPDLTYIGEHFLSRDRLATLWCLLECIDNPSVYVHSTWRRSYKIEEFVQMFNLRVNKPYHLGIDFSKYLKGNVVSKMSSNGVGMDVHLHLTDHPTDSFIILDDKPHRFELFQPGCVYQQDHGKFFQIQSTAGLTLTDCQEVLQFLRGLGVKTTDLPLVFV